MAGQFAYQFTKEIAPFVDYVMDFHTGDGERENMAQIRCSKDDEKVLELAKVFNPSIIVFSNHITKYLRDTLCKMGKTVLLFVGGKSKELNPTITNERVNGTKDVRIHVGVVEGKIAVRETPVFVEKEK